MILSTQVEAKVITEIFYNPEGSDNNMEYVEVRLSNLSNYTISDLVSSDNLTLVNYFEGNFSLIVEEGFNYSGINASIYSAGATIGNNLNNDYDVLFLKNKNGSIVDVAYYYSDMGGNGNNKSLCAKDFSFIECDRSPGSEEEIKNLTIKINEFLPNPEGDDAVGEWIELYNYGTESLNLEGIPLIDNSGKKIFISNVNANNTLISSNGYLIVRMNNFSGFLNNDGFEKITLEDADEVSYSGSREGLSWARFGEAWEKSVPSPGKENEHKSLDTRIRLDNLNLGNDKVARFGETIYVKFDVLRGDTSKKAIKIHIEGNKTVSKISSVSLNNRFVKNEFNLPVQIKDNCDKKFKEGNYFIVIEGLNEEVRKPIRIEENKECKEELVTTNSNKTINLESGDAEKHLNSITGETIYEAKDVSAERSGIYFFCISLVLLIIYLALSG